MLNTKKRARKYGFVVLVQFYVLFYLTLPCRIFKGLIPISFSSLSRDPLTKNITHHTQRDCFLLTLTKFNAHATNCCAPYQHFSTKRNRSSINHLKFNFEMYSLRFFFFFRDQQKLHAVQIAHKTPTLYVQTAHNYFTNYFKYIVLMLSTNILI